MDAFMNALGAPGRTALAAALILMLVGLTYWIQGIWKTKRKRRTMRPKRTIQSARTSPQAPASDADPDNSVFRDFATTPSRPLFVYLM